MHPRARADFLPAGHREREREREGGREGGREGERLYAAVFQQTKTLLTLPTFAQVAALQSYTGPKEDLGTAERFLFELLCIPRLKPRLQCFVFILEFNARLHDLSENVEVFSYAVHDIKRCTNLIKVSPSPKDPGP
jgi:hypothetical protein